MKRNFYSFEIFKGEVKFNEEDEKSFRTMVDFCTADVKEGKSKRVF